MKWALCYWAAAAVLAGTLQAADTHVSSDASNAETAPNCPPSESGCVNLVGGIERFFSTKGITRRRRAMPRGSSSHSAAIPSKLLGLPLYFEENPNPAQGSARYFSRGIGYQLDFTQTGAQFNFANAQALAPVSMHFENPGPNTSIRPDGPLASRSSYLIGNDPKLWRTDLANYGRLRYESLWPGIDLVFYGSNQNLEFDVHAAPHADLNRVSFGFQNVTSLAVQADGSLLVKTPGGVLRQRVPEAYQEVEKGRHPLKARFVIRAANHVGFAVDGYDPELPLVIDPVIDYSTYLGGNLSDVAYSVAVDAQGAAYITGNTTSTNIASLSGTHPISPYPPASPNFYAYVIKLDPTGTQVVYSTYIGGSGNQTAWSIAVDSLSQAHIVGYTTATDFPRASVSSSDSWFSTRVSAGTLHGFVAKLNSSGTGLIYSNIIGGTVGPYFLFGSDEAWQVALDASGNAYVVGDTFSSDFPVFRALQPSLDGNDDAFVMKLGPDGTRIYSTYLGGNGDDQGYAITVDSQGRASVAGDTNSLQFYTGALTDNYPYEIFWARLNAAGTQVDFVRLLHGQTRPDGTSPNPHSSCPTTLYCGTWQEPWGLASDLSGNVYMAGWTTAADFQFYSATTPPGFQSRYGGGQFDGFLASLDSNGSPRFWTYIGGKGGDNVYGLAVDQTNALVYVSGRTNSPDFPVAPGALQGSYGGGTWDGFIASFDFSGTKLVSSSYLGGSGEDVAESVAMGGDGSVYSAGYTTSPNFPTSSVAQLRNKTSRAYSAFVTKLTYSSGCLITLAPQNGISVDATAQSGTLSVQASAASCQWAAVTNVPWITFQQPASGVGSGTISYSLAANSSAAVRNATISVNSTALPVHQYGTGCNAVITPPNLVMDHGGGQVQFNVIYPATSGCSWNVLPDSNAPWITLSSASGGSGTGTFGISAGPNPNSSGRQGTLTIGNQSITVVQNPAGCVFSLSSLNSLFDTNGGAGVINVITSGADCLWTASGDSTSSGWLHVVDTAGYGNGKIRFNVDSQGQYSPDGTTTVGDRSGTLVVNSNQSFQILQLSTIIDNRALTGSAAYPLSGTSVGAAFRAGLPLLRSGAARAEASGTCGTSPFLSLHSDSSHAPISSLTIPVGTTSVQLDLNYDGSCASYVYKPSWTVTPPSYTTLVPGPVTYTITPDQSNPGTSVSAQLTFATIGINGTGGNGILLPITRNGTTCSVQTQQQSVSVAASGGTQQIPISANPTNCDWTVQPSADATWISLPTGNTGTGSDNLTINVQPNPATTERNATIQITGGGQVAIVQPGSSGGCLVALGNGDISLSAGVQTFTVPIAVSASTCSWSVTTSGGFVTIQGSASGTGNGAVTASVGANSGSARVGGISASTSPSGNVATIAIDQAGVLPGPPNNASGTINANPNPIQVCDGSGLGQATISWTTQNVTSVAVKIGTTLFTTGGPNGSQATGKWVPLAGLTFDLWDASSPSGAKLASVTVTGTTQGCNGPPSNATGTITANPNPFQVCDGSGLGQTTISWTTQNVTAVQIKIGNTLFYAGSPSGSQTTGKWVPTSGLTFDLWDASSPSGGKVASVTATGTTQNCGGLPTGTITANPNPFQVCDGSGLGQTTISWTAPNSTGVQIKIGNTLFFSGGPNGSQPTGKWVPLSGLTFDLWDASTPSGTKLSSVTVTGTTSNCGGPGGTATGTISANPNPIQVCDGSGLGQTTINWNAQGVTSTAVKIGSTLFTTGLASGSQATGKWVPLSGLTFDLWDTSSPSGGKLASVTVTGTTSNCGSPPGGATGTISANPNPFQVCDGSGLGQTTISWTAQNVSSVAVKIGTTVFTAGGPTGSVATGKWVPSAGMTFDLWDTSSGTGAKLASVTVTGTTTGCQPAFPIFTTSLPNNCGIFASTTQFHSTVPQIYAYVQFPAAKNGDTVSWSWFPPNGPTSFAALSPSPGSTCAAAILNISGTSNALFLGTWRVDYYYDGAYQSSGNFTLVP